MWFASQFFANKAKNKQIVSLPSCQQQLANIQSNGVDISMAELLQYQNKSALIDLSARKNIHGKMSGNYLSRSKGRGMEFDEVRHYQTGDDIRAIDWRVTARTGKTHTKLFREEIERPVLIATDFSQSMYFGSQLLFKSVQAAHIGALVAWHAKSRGDRLGGIVFNGYKHIELKPRSRKEGVLHYLHALTQVGNSVISTTLNSEATPPEAANAFTGNCARLRQLAKPGSLVYLITDGQQLQTTNNVSINGKTVNDKALKHLGQISQHCELVICLVSDPLEQRLPQSATKLNVMLTDGINRQQLTLGDKNTAKIYQQKAKELATQRQQLLTETGARVIHFSAGETLEQQLKNGVNPWQR